LPYGPEVFAHRSAAGGRHSAFTVISDQGDAWLGPYLHKDAGPSWAFLGWARPDSDWDRRFAAVDSASARFASKLFGLLDDPRPVERLTSQQAAYELIADFAGEPAEAVLGRFVPAGRFDRSRLALRAA
jgi:hypothetical protein